MTTGCGESLGVVMLTNVEAVENTITTLRVEGRLGDADDAFVMMAQGLAAAVDAEPENAALWREYRAALTTLIATGSGTGDDDTQSFLVAVSTAVRHSAVPGSGDVRDGDGDGGGAAGSTPDALAKARSRRRPRATA
jgi:hypothetical protein